VHHVATRLLLAGRGIIAYAVFLEE